MKQTVFSYGCDITDAYRKLKHMASETLEEVGGDFNGQKLDSTMTLDDMFKAVTGRAKAEHEKLLKEQQDKYKQEEQKHKESIPSLVAEYIERGHKLLNESTWDAWDECVPVRLNDLYRGMELDCTLRLVEMLDINGCDIKEASAEFDKQGHSGMSASLMFSMMRAFCKRGEEFIQVTK